MKIGVDATCWQNTRGYGRHARSLLRALLHLDHGNDYTFVMDAAAPSDRLPANATVQLVQAGTPTAVAAAAAGRRSLSSMWRMSRAMSDPAFDLLLFPTVYSYVPVWSRAKKIVMIHDIIAETFPDLTVPSRVARLSWKAKVAAGRRQADAIATVSDYSRRGIVNHFGLSPDHIHVVGEASDPVFRVQDNPSPTSRMQSLGLDGRHRMIVYVGGFGPHKNLTTLVSAFAAVTARPGFEDARLVMVGEYKREVFHTYFDALEAQIKALDLAGRVIFTGYLSDEELVILLNLATALALPSLMEGFGLPAVEAAACGCPVIATTASPLPELLGEGGRYVDPHNQAGWEAALGDVLASEDRQRQMGAAGVAAAGQLTWDAAARQMLDIIHQVAS